MRKTSLLWLVLAGQLYAGPAAAAFFRPANVEPPMVRPQPGAVTLKWLDGAAPPSRQGVSFGVPWPQGALRNNTPLALTTGDGRSVPVQTWPLAYWPDGSLKWTGQAISAAPDLSGPLTLAPGNPAAPPTVIRAAQSADGIEIDTGAMQCRIPARGPAFLTSLRVGGREVARDGQLVLIREDRAEYESGGVLREERFAGRIDKVTLEQSGPVRAVVKIEGMHQAAGSTRAWLPFTLRLYFFAGLDSARLVHSFVFDGDQERDFIKGLGVRFSVPMREQVHNRHLRLAGESGLLAEPLRLLPTRNVFSQDLYARQIAGQPIPNLDQLNDRARTEKMAVWDGFKLTQSSADSFIVQKRTGARSSWIQAAAGKRALGTAFIGDTSGGLAVGMKNFWQLAPTALEVQKASTDAAELTLWLWSPDAPAMDLRHYSEKEHGLDASYEDITPGFSTATGVARTSELTLQAFAETPPNDNLWRQTQATAQTPRLVCTPDYYHSIPVFGVWSLPDRSTPGKRSIEDQLDRALTFYQGQVEQRRWYGFWDYGDVMHSYDSTRHNWRYDVGGYAWANAELMPDLWLWYSFLRTGRADIFRMAEAMTRHTQEVDVYH
ncbi:MAG TPA: Tat pathway signal sequence domain protein, partial [Blastocatellia bacterium]|nr:Tat pathway signal sequence domain protein [Blastocatellia bacterium]